MERPELYDRVTNQIIAALESGTAPWKKPWVNGGGFLPLRHNGIPYRGVNVLILWIAAEEKGYGRSHWMTFNQAREYGGCVRKGEKSTTIIYCEPVSRKETAPDGTETETYFWIHKYYNVFNVEQCDGLPQQFDAAKPVLDPCQRIQHAETFFANLGAKLDHGGSRAFYRPLTDSIQMPPFEFFRTPEAYYSTLGHESLHWTGHASRLQRLPLPLRGGIEDRAMEELLSEIGTSYLSAHLGLMPVEDENRAAYVADWLQSLSNDSKYVFVAAAKAQAAVDYLIGKQPKV